jgi:hypothetical protein
MRTTAAKRAARSFAAREAARLKREIGRHRTLEHLAKQLVRVQRRADGALGELAAHLAREVGGRFIPPPVPVNPDDFVGPTAQTCSRCALRPIAAPALCWPCVCEVAAERRGEPLDRAGGEPCPA